MIKISGLTKTINENTILSDINLEIKKGSVFGLLGVNGAGKSTLLRLMCGIYRPDSGEITYGGKPVYENPEIKEKIFFINDETVQFSGMTLNELKNFYKAYYPNFSEELFETLRKNINLPSDKKLSSFSKGMKRQSVVITGIACQTEYLLMDEAFDGLDPAMRVIVKNMIFDAVMDRELTVVISSHNLRELSEICDSAAMLNNNTVAFYRDTDSDISICKINTAFSEEYTESDFAGLDVVKIERSQSLYTMLIKNSREEIQKALESKNPAFLDIVPLTLEEIFIYEMEANGYNEEGTD